MVGGGLQGRRRSEEGGAQVFSLRGWCAAICFVMRFGGPSSQVVKRSGPALTTPVPLLLWDTLEPILGVFCILCSTIFVLVPGTSGPIGSDSSVSLFTRSKFALYIQSLSTQLVRLCLWRKALWCQGLRRFPLRCHTLQGAIHDQVTSLLFCSHGRPPVPPCI